MSLTSLRNSAFQRAGKILRGAGIDISPIETRRGFAGFRVQFRRDQPEIRRGAVIEASHGVRFFVGDEGDLVQRYHLRGEFYEAEELALIAPYVRGLVADIGANVGNHTLYFLTQTAAGKVIAVEPNPPAYRILDLNIRLNGLTDRAEVHRVGLSDSPGTAHSRAPYRNLGGSWLEPGGDIPIVAGDTLFADQPVSFMKIDVEKMEMKVLAGLRETIARHRPAIFIEIDDVNTEAFEAFRDEIGYRTELTHRRYPWSVNYLILPA